MDQVSPKQSKETDHTIEVKANVADQPEEDDNIPFAKVTEELEILNKEGQTRLYTGPYGRIMSPFKKFSSFTSQRGVKRSPRKLPLPHSKRVKVKADFDLLGTDSESSDSDTSPDSVTPEKVMGSPNEVAGPSLDPQPSQQGMDEETEDSDSEDDQWQIMEESETEIDKQLDEKSDKYSLSAINVKSIIHKIVTNEKVVEMVRRAVLEQVEEKKQEYEPKMTRSKAKKAMEKQEDVPHPLGLSPSKKAKDKSKFLEIDLPEDEEDDEDFNPDKIGYTHGSEDDSESVLSSSYSDCETSSLPSTPSTPVGQQTLVIKDSKTPTNPETDNSNSFLSPMGPPLQNFVPRSHHKSSSLGQKYKDAIERDEQAKREEEELIASRTRSKCPLNKVSLFDLEATFVAPDITEDMYDTTCDDKDWNDFLKTLIVFDNNNTEDTNEAGGEEEDPEFNFLEEAEHAEYDQEDFRNDRAVKVSKKELNLLIDELNEAYYEDDPIDVKSKKVIKAQTETIVVANSQKRQSEAPDNLVYDVADKEKRQIADQLRQHVQLLTQSFVLGMGDPEEHENVIDATKMFLTELKTFADKSELTCPDTLLKVCNLESALSVITDPIWQSTVELSADETDRMDGLKFRYENQELPRLNYKQMKILWTSTAFMYPELLPHGGFYMLSELKKDRSRIKFIEPEDNLLAMGLDQFSHLPNGKEYIHTFMLPCKTKKQIMIRMKNLSAKTAKNNAVKYWKDNKKLPVFPKSAPFFKPEMMKACKDRNISLAEFPSWASFFRPEDAAQGSSVSDLRPIMIHGCQYLTADPDDKSLSILSEETNSTPDNTLQTTDSSTVASSSSSGNSISKVQAKTRPKKLTRKRLDLDKGNKRSVPAFIPLSFSGTIKSSNSNLTIISVSNNMSSDSLKLNRLFHQSVSAANIATTSINRMQSLPSTRVVDSGSSVSSAEALTSNVSMSSGSTGTSIPVSSVSADENTSVHNLPSNSNTSVEACVSGSGGSGDSSHGTTTNNHMSVSSVTNDRGSGDTLTSADVCKPTVDSMPLLIGSEDHAQRQSTSQASVSTTPGVIDRTVQRIVLSPLSNFNNNAVQTVQCTSSQTSPSVSNQASPFISRNPAGVSDEDGFTPDTMSTCSTPQKSTQSMSPISDVSGTPKSALEIIASYAPYLLSPSANRDHQKVLETTPKKKSGFIKLAPKPTPPGSGPSPTVSIHVPKVQSSPKRKMLNRQAKAILPKGFIVRSFDVSPSKKAASSLVEKAKNPSRKSRSQSFYFSSSGSYCKILPQPSSAKQSKHDGSTMKSGITQTLGYIGSGRSLSKIASASANKPCRSSNAVKPQVDDNKENAEVRIEDKTESGQNVDMEVDEDDDKAVDTESDYTQSEDGNETQEELDSQEEVDSQEDDDSHIANLMQASTTTSRFDLGKDDASKSHLGKKDRDRDTTLAMLAPDVISTDPQRDVRDTAFAQAYLHKVKKTLRDDMDSLEKFLQLMYNFSKAKESPIKLYTELKDLFQDYPGLLHDFAGFLLQEQAVECGCYDAFEEFNSARSFLRKIELHFSKTPYHFQRIIKTFSRWYRKSGRSTRDLKNEIEPMLKGHKYLLEEFSKFFPAEPPPDSMMDDFEEINLEGTDDEVKYDSFEEIELFEGEEVLGTKRCTCACHQSKDETYRKKKKHCYRCCLTVIDGELVYRVNKSTIKKINITFGPPMKASNLLMLDTDETENTEKMAVKALETDTEVGKESDVGENLIQVDREPTDTDSGCVIDSDGMEKEMVPGGCVKAGATKESDKVASKHSSSNYKSVVTEISSSIDRGEELQVSGSLRQESDITAREPIQSYTDKTTNTADSVINRSADGSVKATNDQLRLENNRKPNPDQNNEATTSEFNNSGNVIDKCESEQPKMKSKNINDNPKTVSELSNPSHSSSDTALANDILAAAFNAALTSDVSLDNVFPFPLATQYEQGKPKAVLSAGVHELFDRDATFSNDSQKLWKRSGENANLEKEPKPVTEKTITSTSTPMLQKEATIQSQSNYSSNSKVEPAGDVSVVTSDSVRQSGELDSIQVFSPFSPFGQEIQSITNAKSPAPNKVPSVSKVRRITPIPVKKGASGDDESFQSVVQNSPVITDMIQSPLSQIVLEKSTDDSNSSKVGRVISEESNKLSSIPIPFTEFGSNSAKSSDSLSQRSVDTEMSSQKSDSSGRTVTSGNTANSSTARPLKISQPAIFSEDANVGFTGTSEYMAAHISDDSLLQCLGKPAHFNDTIGTVSNLTNILNALDDKSLHSKSEEALKGKADNEELDSYHGETDSITSVVPSATENQTAKEEKGDDTPQETNSVTKTFMEKDKVDTEMITVNLLQSCDSSDSGQKTDSQYIPQSVQSIENLKRIDSGLFRVTSLSDSESSLTQSNSITQMHLVSNKDNMPSHENNLEQQKVGFNDVTAVSQDRLPVQEQQKITEGVIVETDVQGKSGSEAESLRDSDHINKQEKENCPETPDQMTVTEDFEKEPQQIISIPEESNANIGNTQIESCTISNVLETSVDQLKDNFPSIDQKRTNPNESETRECIRNDPENKADSTKPVSHSTESVKEQSLSDHDKSKQEIRRKRKKTDKGEAYNSSKKSKKKKKKKREQKTEEMLDSPDVSSQDSETGTEHYVRLKEKDSTPSLSSPVSHETDKVSGVESSVAGPVCVQSPGLMSTSSSVQGSPASPSQLSVHSPGPSSISNDGCTADELMWTKETDKIILEKCKSHGVKERTFVKIAKKLGNVTAKQVRKRFSHLYQLIFGSQFSSEDGKGTSSS